MMNNLFDRTCSIELINQSINQNPFILESLSNLSLLFEGTNIFFLGLLLKYVWSFHLRPFHKLYLLLLPIIIRIMKI